LNAPAPFLEKWSWLFIFGGLLTLGLGLALLRIDAAWGWWVVVPAALAAAAGVVMIFLRARLPDAEPAPRRPTDRKGPR